MLQHVVLLRGINLVQRNRISMPDLRVALGAAGFSDARTYVQSGNVVLSRDAPADQVAEDVRRVLKKAFGLEITVLVRSRDELAEVIRRNPLAQVATNPRRYLVTFLSDEFPEGVAAGLESAAGQEPFAIIGREVYSWHPDGVGRSVLWGRLANKSLGIAATSRNWATVTALLAMADTPAGR